MFLDALRKQNQPLIDTSLGLLRQHKLTPDTWVIDVDMVEENARRILQTAEKYRVTPYVMSKQFGRNPWLTQQIIALGFSGAVAVDFREADASPIAACRFAIWGIWCKSRTGNRKRAAMPAGSHHGLLI